MLPQLEIPRPQMPRATAGVNAPPEMTAIIPPQLTEPTPERLSETAPATARFAAATVTPFAGELILTTGGVSSMLKLRDVLLLFPALSVADPETVWFAPSEVMLVGEGHDATPDRASVQEKLTVTGELFQPAKLGAGL